MRKIFLFLLMGLVLGIGFNGTAQENINPREIKISELSDNQIRRIHDEMMNRGLSEQQAISLAMARGFTRQQINELERRFEQLGDVSQSQSGNEKDEEAASLFGEVSEKEEVTKTEERKKLFGFDFFNSENLTFEPSVNLPASKSYIIGPGDEFSIDIWGTSQQSYQLTVDNGGNLNIPNVGPVAVGSLTLEEAEKKVFNKLTLIYRDLAEENPKTFAHIYLAQIRPIKVHVIGEAFAPGSYTLPGSATAFNALYLAGGPNMNGSFREIKIIRDGRQVKTLDVYEYLINGKTHDNISLRDDDVIMVPSYRYRVRMSGEFKRTGIFEGKQGETVADMLDYAGGFTDKAYQERLEVFRTNSRQNYFEGVGRDNFDDVLIQNGDSIIAGEILKRVENRVIMEGAVMRPGNYELTEDLSLTSLLERAEGLREDAFMERGQILRLDDNLELENIPFSVKKLITGDFDIDLKREDIVTIYSRDSLRQERDLTIKGEVQYPGTFDYRDGTTLSDLVAMAGGFTESASSSYIEVARRLSHDEKSEYSKRTGHLFQFTISRNLEMDEQDGRFELQPYDQVFVRRAPGFVNSGTVRINGEVLYAGEYNLSNREERLSSVIERTGGLTPDAYAQGAMLTRKVETDAKTKRLREQLMERDSTLQFDDMGFEVLAIDLRTALENPGTRDDVFLQAGDELFIPRELQTIKISGEVLNPVSAPFVEGKSLRHYVDQGGGFSDMAKKSKAYVIYSNGKAAATSNFLFFKNYPKVLAGSEIVIPSKPHRDPLPATAWISIGSSVASLALTVVTISNTLK
ncbi:SLBB domain-containing protein [Marinilabilia salmonicolor]|uniref:SLBB domain-containing protein n=1 Tax=Marinilabilia salmonicolor TaxID=989 RepID=UPI00046A7C81|nr:SLBB domain-containing protein [Marinilabilia salmonicolor]